MEAATEGTDLRVFGDGRKAGPPSGLPCFERSEKKQQVSRPAEVDEGLWEELMAPVLRKWQLRAGTVPHPIGCLRELNAAQRLYARRRVNRLEKTYVGRSFTCGKDGLAMRCKCGPSLRPKDCRQHLVCRRCQKARMKKFASKIRNGLLEKTASSDRLVVHVTIALRHSGDIARDRRDLVAAWRRFYKRVGKEIGAFPFVGVHELTIGHDKLGHPHAHVVCLWPWLDWGVLQKWWVKAAGGRAKSTRIGFRAHHNVHAAANYLAKYVSKGVDTADFSTEMRARAVAGTYGSRWLFSSRGFWAPFEPVCPCCKHPITRDIVTRWLASDAGVTSRGRPDDDPDPGGVYQLTIEEIHKADERDSARGLHERSAW